MPSRSGHELLSECAPLSMPLTIKVHMVCNSCSATTDGTGTLHGYDRERPTLRVTAEGWSVTGYEGEGATFDSRMVCYCPGCRK